MNDWVCLNTLTINDWVCLNTLTMNDWVCLNTLTMNEWVCLNTLTMNDWVCLNTLTRARLRLHKINKKITIQVLSVINTVFNTLVFNYMYSGV